MKLLPHLMLAVLFGLLPALSWSQPQPAAFVPDQVLLRFDKPTGLAAAKRVLDGAQFTVAESLVPALDIYLVRLNGKLAVSEAVALLKGRSDLRWVQPDHYLDLRAVPNDPSFASQWNLSQPSDFDVDAPEAWDLATGGTDTGGRQIVIAIVDNGASLTQTDLAPNLWVNTGEIAGNGVDDDLNGYIDDINGWDAYGNDGGIPVPSNHHGTHVAGIAGARGNNANQIAGVNWNVKLMIVAASSSTTSIVTRGYNYVLTQKTRWRNSGGTQGANVVAANSSFGVNFGNCNSDSFPLWNDLYNAMGAVGILSPCATANLSVNVDVQGDVPTTCASPYIIAVTNTNSSDQKVSNAGWGPVSIDLGAPGASILSTYNSGTGLLSGTSMAAPHVAGAIALMHAAASADFNNYYMTYPDSAARKIKQMILGAVDLKLGFDTLCVSGGRLNLFNAVSAARNWAAPRVTVTSPNGGEAWNTGSPQTIRWTAVGFTGNVNVQINRDYPAGSWETLFANTPNDSAETWNVSGSTSNRVRIRVRKADDQAYSDISDADFTILGPLPVLRHDPLADVAPGTGTVTAWAWSPSAAVAMGGVKMLYRQWPSLMFDSLALASTANPNEFAASLATLDTGFFEYYIRATDLAGRAAYAPPDAPASFYRFEVDLISPNELAYDDGGAEAFTWNEAGSYAGHKWAVKFGPVNIPFALCGARFAASRLWPDSIHHEVAVAVYAADGLDGTPGTLLRQVRTGSIGNVVGGLLPGTHWAQVSLRDTTAGVLLIADPEFYIAVFNPDSGVAEAIGRDTTGVPAGRSFVYDPCADLWLNEADVSAATFGGNRLLRAQGFSVFAPQVVILRDGDHIILHWPPTGAPLYRVYSAPTSDGPFTTFEGMTTDTTFTDTNAVPSGIALYYQVHSATE